MLSFSICGNVLGLRCVQIVLHTCMCMHLLLFLHVTNTESFLRKIKMFFVLLLQAARSRRRDWAGERAGTVSTTWSPTCSIRSASTLSCRTGPKGLQSPPLRRHVRTWALNTRVIHMLQVEVHCSSTTLDFSCCCYFKITAQKPRLHLHLCVSVCAGLLPLFQIGHTYILHAIAQDLHFWRQWPTFICCQRVHLSPAKYSTTV